MLIYQAHDINSKIKQGERKTSATEYNAQFKTKFVQLKGWLSFGCCLNMITIKYKIM